MRFIHNYTTTPPYGTDSEISSYADVHEIPVFLLAGRFFETTPQLKSLNTSLNLKDFKLVGTGKQGDRDCVILRHDSVSGRSRGTQEFWFDAGEKKALLRWVRTIPAGVVSDIRFSYADPGANPWPREWQFDSYDPANKRLNSQNKMRVVSLELNKPYLQEDFQVKRAPGMVVSAKGGYVRVNDDLSTTKINLDGPVPPPPRPPWRSAYRWLAGLLILAAILAAVLYGRARSVRRTKPEGP